MTLTKTLAIITHHDGTQTERDMWQNEPRTPFHHLSVIEFNEKDVERVELRYYYSK